MKAFYIFFILLFQTSIGLSQATGDILTLKGYFIVSCFDTTIMSGCDLNIKKTGSITGDSMTCGDGNFYRNISIITYVDPVNLDLKQIDKFSYQVELQKNEHMVFLSTDPSILSESGDSSLSRDTILIQAIQKNQITAEEIQKQIDRLHLNFKEKNHYYVLMEVSVKVLILPERKKPTTYVDPFGLQQYLLLYDEDNQIKKVKVIEDPF